MAVDDTSDGPLEVRIQDEIPPRGGKSSRSINLKKSRRILKRAQITEYGPEDEDRTSRRELRLATFPWKKDGAGYDFDDPTFSWHCENQEIDDLRDFLALEVGEPGDKLLVDRNTAIGALVQAAATGDLQLDQVRAILEAIASSPERLRELGAIDAAHLLGSAAQLHRHRTVIDELETLVADSDTTEPDLSDMLKREWWLFGRRYVGLLDRHRFTGWDDFDFVLERTDGAYHVVEIKRANAPLVVRHGGRQHHIVSDAVNAAVGQAAHYLHEVDRIEDNLTVRTRGTWARCHATAVIGHPVHSDGDIEPAIVRETLRTFNSHLARIEVLTYEDLIAMARRDVQRLGDAVVDEYGDGQDEVPPTPPPPTNDDVPF